VAVRESWPTGKVVVVNVAIPFPLRVAVPKLVVPFLNCTFPVGVVEPVEVTWAVRVTD